MVDWTRHESGRGAGGTGSRNSDRPGDRTGSEAHRPAYRAGGLGLLAVVALLVAPSLLAAQARGAGAPIATTELAGTHLTVSPESTFEHATLRVAGPGGFEAITWSDGGPLTLDLLAEGRVLPADGAPGGRLLVLPDGRYAFEAVVHQASGERRVASGTFRVENGVVKRAGARPDAAPAHAPLAPLALRGRGEASMAAESDGLAPKSGSTNDIFLVNDGSNDGEVNLQLRSNTSTGALINYWGVRNEEGDLHLSTSGGANWDDQVTVTPSGRVGIGTAVPGAELDVRGPGGAIHLTDIDACPNANASWDVEEDFGKLKFGVLANCPGDLAGGKLWITGAGELGIGTPAPGDSLHINRPFPAIRLTDSDPCGQAGSAASWQINEAFGKLRFGVVTKCSGDPAGTKLSITGDGNVGIGTQNPAARLHVIGNGIIEGDVAFGSSRTIKREIEPLDGGRVLDEVRDLPVYSWKYKADPDQAPHVGPMAEDVHATFGLGRDGQHLSPADSAGLALAAVKGLDQELAAVRAQNRDLAAENRDLRRRLAQIEQRLAVAPEAPAPRAP